MHVIVPQYTVRHASDTDSHLGEQALNAAGRGWRCTCLVAKCPRHSLHAIWQDGMHTVA